MIVPTATSPVGPSEAHREVCVRVVPADLVEAAGSVQGHIADPWRVGEHANLGHAAAPSAPDQLVDDLSPVPLPPVIAVDRHANDATTVDSIGHEDSGPHDLASHHENNDVGTASDVVPHDVVQVRIV
ncbi:MAG: hypothetical protein ABIP36_01395 [Acidimicrobiales bacterium]